MLCQTVHSAGCSWTCGTAGSTGPARRSLATLITVHFDSLCSGWHMYSSTICAALTWPAAHRRPFREPTRFIMQITLHLPSWPRVHARVCLRSRCTEGERRAGEYDMLSNVKQLQNEFWFSSSLSLWPSLPCLLLRSFLREKKTVWFSKKMVNTYTAECYFQQ